MTKISNLYGLTNYITANTSGNVVIEAPTSGTALYVTGSAQVTGQLTLGSTITDGTNTYTLPSATGTLALASSLGSYLPLAGGTMSGAIVGTTASFAMSGSGIALETIGSGTGDAIRITHSSGRALTLNSSGSGYGILINSDTAATSAPFTIQKQGATKISFTDAGAGTFGGTLSATGATLTGTLSGTSATFSSNVQLTGDGYVYGNATAGSGTIRAGIRFNSTAQELKFFTADAGRLTIDSGGAATFSSSVAIGGESNNYSGLSGLFALQNGNNSYYSYDQEGGIVGNAYYASGWKYKTSNKATRYISNVGTHAFEYATTGTAGGALSWTPAMYINNSGNVGIGTTAPSKLLSLGTSGAAPTNGFNVVYNDVEVASFTANSVTGEVKIGATNAVGTFFTTLYSNNTERMRITSGGYVLVGDDSTSARLSVKDNINGNTIGARNTGADYAATLGFFAADRNTTNNTFFFLRCYNYGSSSYKFNVADSGNVTNANNSYGAISDIKLKENISDATSKLSDLLKIKVKNFNFIGNNEKQLGVIAQEVEEIFPGLVEINKDRDGDGNDLGTVTKSVKYSVFVPMLIKAVQEQQTQIEELKQLLNN